MAGGFDPKTFSIKPIQTRIEKPWGYEIKYSPENAPFTGKILHVKAGSQLSLQYHDKKTESLCLFSGKAIITLSDENDKTIEIEMEPLKGYLINIGQVHRITAVEDSDILESSLPETGNTYRLQDDANRQTETEEMRSQPNRGWKGGGA